MKRILFSLLAAALVLGLGWIGGIDFDERGINTMMVVYIALVLGGSVYFYPGWNE